MESLVGIYDYEKTTVLGLTSSRTRLSFVYPKQNILSSGPSFSKDNHTNHPTSFCRKSLRATLLVALFAMMCCFCPRIYASSTLPTEESDIAQNKQAQSEQVVAKVTDHVVDEVVAEVMNEVVAKVTDSVQVRVSFPAGKTEIDLNFQQNGTRLAQFINTLAIIETDPNICPESIRIVGYASPEGTIQINQRLARERAKNLVSYILSKIAIPDSLLNITHTGVDWQGLEKMVEESFMKNKAEVLNIIRNEPEFTYNAKRRTHTLSQTGSYES